MMSLKRMLRIGIPLIVLALALLVYAQSPAHAASCGHPTVVASILQKVGLSHSHSCAVMPNPNGGPGEWCVNTGHHCNDGAGPGRCLTVFEPSGLPSCQCVGR